MKNLRERSSVAKKNNHSRDFSSIHEKEHLRHTFRNVTTNKMDLDFSTGNQTLQYQHTISGFTVCFRVAAVGS